MKPKTLILMVVAIGCGLVASYMTSRVIADRQEKPTEEKVAVLVARQNIPMGTLIKDPEKFFEEKQFTKGEEPKKAIREFETLKDKRLNKPLSAEQFVTPDDLQSKEQEGIAALMKPGMRAFAIKVDAQSAVGGFVQPHSRVDVVSVNRRNEADTSAKIIVQNILVLAVDQTAMRQDDKQAVIANTVTVQVTPQQAEVLTMASALGELKLILRPYGDDEKVTTSGATPKGIAQAGDKGDDSGTLLEGEPKTRSPLGLGKIPDVPMGTKVAAAPVEAKQPETPAQPPPKTHTLTIYNGDTMTKAIFTLSDKDGKGEPKNDKSPATKPAEKSPTKS